jgi:hypothetical protein
MPYLDEDILYNNVEEKYKSAKGKAREAYSDVLDTICEMPRADVAPKSEVAREIFEEMFEKLNHIVITADVGVEYNTFKKTIKQVCAAVSAELSELKKKYTERCTDCKHFVGCECFSGMTCDEYTEEKE